MEVEDTKVDGFRIKKFIWDDLIVGISTDFGPRVLFLANTNKPDFNIFVVLPESGDKTSEGFCQMYGGHRLWSSPEAMPRTYSIDDKPVRLEISEDLITIYGNPEPANSIQKKIVVKHTPKKRTTSRTRDREYRQMANSAELLGNLNA